MSHLLVSRSGPEVVARCGHTARCVGGRQPASFTIWATEVTCHSCGPVTAEQWRAIHAARSRSEAVLGHHAPAWAVPEP